MEWNLSPEQDAYQEAFRGWLSDVAPPDAVRRWLDAGDAAAFEKLFARTPARGGQRPDVTRTGRKLLDRSRSVADVTLDRVPSQRLELAGPAEGARTADGALTLHGAIGYTWEYDLQLFYKRARLDEKLLGTPAQWNGRIATGLALV